LNTDPLKRFRDAVAPERLRINLAEAALLCAQDAYPELDVQSTLGEIERIGTTLARRMPQDFSTTHRLIALNNYLFRELGFVGNHAEYYDPRNSFLNEVMARKTGIPITLSILYIDIGERLGLKLKGVSFPGHFLVKVRVTGGELVLDPFSGGKSLSEEELRERLAQVAGSEAAHSLPLEDFLEPASPRQILARLLRNLKAIYLEAADLDRALGVMNRLVILLPEAPEERRDRGRVFARLECARAAADDLGFYAAHRPQADDAVAVAAELAAVTIAAARLN
jgi:regulator of sirC expression with transglutaminase-like and TPR domain